MSKFEKCKCRRSCIDYSYNSCDDCQIFKSYMTGYEDSVEYAELLYVMFPNSIIITCSRCKDSYEIHNTEEYMKNHIKFCRYCGAIAELVKQ